MSQQARNAQVAHLARCEVLRPFQGSKDGEVYTYQRGEIVDARPWRHAEALISQRLLVPLPQELVSDLPSLALDVDDETGAISVKEQTALSEPRGRSRAA